MAFAAGQNSRLLDMQRKFQQKHLTESKKNTIQSPSISIKEKIQIKVPEKHVTVSHENLKIDFSVKGKVTAIKTTSKILPPTIRGAENKPVLGAQNGKKDCDIYTKSVGEKKIVNKKSPPQKLTVKPTEQTKLPSLNNNKRNIKVSTIKTEVKSPPKPPPRANKETPKIITSIKPLANRPIAPGMERCPYCSRDFNSERIEKHKTVCLQTQKKKRKVFDMTKQRLEGTDAKEFINSAKSKASVPKKKNNWRQKHEEFVANIRNARMAQQHLAKGGNLADLPPPPPLDTSDLIPCPHCGRKFNDNAAARHIPLCLERQKKKPIVKQSVKRF
ncbi:zinc finger C2HC domain-containing protein 1C-like [Daktulosphaira vitifoliae]|uniref:zinc finger C2HC domain-containing protein 1C-like n=1 Tax=Daktulosphaira vitifoliae TaxID=58002 RepID=UPI0021AACDE1|nr:zinc finger C2HC domain-containing protein 1C-like [Daktulosphaira vitifoliae]XP_050526561.1 zinc finger C2HC domain-containing protein 1C-like [Daktulosphaira vitifoliae]XP_050526562.1 zinc finger C2HC domain-containing protein 1C-like [Daktulosphaira vitifoliae]XP_050526563.1 zinc finger C2HC domain-containing protein 1C-like [Daktulosphaira vitifoliae]